MHPGYAIQQVYLCTHPVDFRKSIVGLSALVEQELGLNPFGAALYVFIHRARNKMKVLYWSGNGFCLWYKKLEQEKFAWPKKEEQDCLRMSPREFEWLLEGYDPWRNKPHKMLQYQCVT